MEDVSLETLAGRLQYLEGEVGKVAELERAVRDLKRPAVKDWRIAAAVPSDPELARQIGEAGLAWREEERRLAEEAWAAEDAARAAEQ